MLEVGCLRALVVTTVALTTVSSTPLRALAAPPGVAVVLRAQPGTGDRPPDHTFRSSGPPPGVAPAPRGDRATPDPPGLPDEPASTFLGRWTWPAVAAIVAAEGAVIAGLLLGARRRRMTRSALADQVRMLSASNEDLAMANRRLRLEQQVREQAQTDLRHADKMEAVARLAGGVAHDFNNQLTVIVGYCALLLGRTHDDVDRDAIGQIRRAAEHAALLTQNLLAFSREQVVVPVVLDVGAAIRLLAPILRRFSGPHVELVLDVDADSGCCRLGEGQIDQMLANLVANARDAMPHGGIVTVTCHKVTVRTLRSGGPAPGTHVRLAVSDTGTGMDAETCARVFDPFFTTRRFGGNRGLGLPVVYGIVRQHGGHVSVDSRPGAGTTVHVWLPAVPCPPMGRSDREFITSSP